ncbi:MAG: NifB/NifX family molybdenum-iron cluster-binding protein [Dehalococcoidia bacterium]
MRIAVASTDKRTVNQPFGKTPQFLIIEVGDDNLFEITEIRDNTPDLSKSGPQGKGGTPMSSSVAMLADCEAVFSVKFGIGGYNELAQNDIHPYQTKNSIEDAINGYLRYKEADAKAAKKSKGTKK